MDYLRDLAFGYYPYVAFGVFILASIMRFNYAQYGWKSGSSQMLSNKGMRIASNFFHFGIILLLLSAIQLINVFNFAS